LYSSSFYITNGIFSTVTAGIPIIHSFSSWGIGSDDLVHFIKAPVLLTLDPKPYAFGGCRFKMNSINAGSGRV
jgi:hypothetical protein